MNKEKIYFTVIEWCTYLSLFTPLVFLKNFFFPFVVPKTIFFRIIVDIMFIAYVLLVTSNKKYLPRINALTVSIAVFLIVAILTSITGVNIVRSFWSTFERMTGLITFFHLFVYFIILSSVFTEKKQWEKILTVSIFVGIAIFLYAVTTTEAITRGGGTVGNTSFFAGYLLFNIFFALVLFLTKDGNEKVLYFILLAASLAGLFISKEPCRGAIAALIIGLAFMAFCYMVYLLYYSQNPNRKIMAVFIPLLIVIVGLGLLQLDFFKDKITETIQSGSIQSRLIVWKMGWNAWQEKLWLGWGQENFNVAFSKYFDPTLPLTKDLWYDRVHNIVLDVGVTSGIIGLLSYLGMFFVSFFSLFRIVPKIAIKKNVFFPLGMMALLIVYFAQNIWVFDMISSYMSLFLAFSFINFLVLPPRKEEPETETQEKPGTLRSALAGVLIIIGIITIYTGNVKVAQASNYAVKGLYFELKDSYDYFQKAMASSPVSTFEVPEQILNKFLSYIGQVKPEQQELLKEALNFSETTMRKCITDNPNDFRSKLFLGKYYLNAYSVERNPKYLEQAEELLFQAKDLSPVNQQVHWYLGQLRIYQQKPDEAIAYFKKAIELEPRLGDSYWYLINAYNLINRNDLAAQELENMDKLQETYPNGYRDWKSDINDVYIVIRIYTALGDKNKMLYAYELARDLTPKEPTVWSSLADLYAALGRKEEAREAALKFMELDPSSATRTQNFLKSIGY